MLMTGEIESRRARFAQWRGTRPFFGAAMCVLSGLLLLLPAFTTFHVGNVLVTISSISGVSTALLGALMMVCAASVLTRPTTTLPAGVCAMIIALVALPAANLGGFIVGTVCGVIGASAILAWTAGATTDQTPPAATSAS